MGERLTLLALILLLLVGSAAKAAAAEKLRSAFPSLATALSPSWIAAEKGFWKKYGLDVELIYLDGGARSVSALIGTSV